MKLTLGHQNQNFGGGHIRDTTIILVTHDFEVETPAQAQDVRVGVMTCAVAERPLSVLSRDLRWRRVNG